MTEQLKEQTFEVNLPAALRVENIRGSVYIRSEARTSIQVTAIKYTETGDAGETKLVFEAVDDSTVLIATRVENPLISGISKKQVRPCRVRYEILAPEDCSLNLECVSASAELHGLRGDHRIELVSGDLDFQNLTGDLNIHTVSGDIRGQVLSGAIDISSVSGDIKLLELYSDSVKLHTVSGDMLIDTETILDGCSIETVSGNVRLNLLPEAAFTVHMTSFSGEIRSELPSSHNPNPMGLRVCEIQGGGPTLRLQSLSGDLIIRNKIGETLAAAEDPPPTVDSMDILEQVASGELSVDRAIEALQE